MKGFIKFISILLFGFFCFAGGVAKEDGNNDASMHCILGGTLILLIGFANAVEMDARELIEKNRKKKEEFFKETRNSGKKLKA